MRLKADIQATFGADVGIQGLFISEFGQMYPNIDEFVPDMTKVVFLDEVFRDTDLSHLVIHHARFTPCCNVLAMTMPRICNVGSHHAAKCLPPEVSDDG